MKRAFYVAAFVLLGILLQFIVHALIEMGVIALLLKDFGRYGLGLSWQQWFLIHHALTIVLLAAGVVWGYKEGERWWKAIYVEKRFGWPPKWKKRL
jgi:hypothetical protein